MLTKETSRFLAPEVNKRKDIYALMKCVQVENWKI